MKGMTVKDRLDRIKKLEKFVKATDATDETIELLLLEIRQLSQLVEDVSSLPVAEEAPVEEQKVEDTELKNAIDLLILKHF
jgi:hypothetical protein